MHQLSLLYMCLSHKSHYDLLAWSHAHFQQKHTNLELKLCISLSVYVCVCVCACMWECMFCSWLLCFRYVNEREKLNCNGWLHVIVMNQSPTMMCLEKEKKLLWTWLDMNLWNKWVIQLLSVCQYWTLKWNLVSATVMQCITLMAWACTKQWYAPPTVN